MGRRCVGYEAQAEMTAQRRILSTALILLGGLLAFRSWTAATNRWSHDDNRVLPLLGASATAVAAGLYARAKRKK